MPRREKDKTVSDSVDAATAVATQAEAAEAGSEQASEQPVIKPPKEPLPLGPMTTRTGAEALVIPSPKGTRVFTAGGDKGQKIKELLTTKPEMPRKDIAALVGCSQSRVAEVARVLGLAQGRPSTPTAATSDQAESQATPEAANA